MRIMFAAIVAALFIVPIFFFFNHLFYDQNGPWMDLWSKKVKIKISSVERIEQTITSQNDQFSKITIPIAARRKMSLNMAIIDKDMAIARTKEINIRANQQNIEWEFKPLGGFQNIYTVKLDVPRGLKTNIGFFLIPSRNFNEQVVIDDQLISDKTLAYFTMAKFDNTNDKLKTLYERIKTHKPDFIQALLLPLFLIYMGFFSIGLWRVLKIIKKDG